MAELELRRANVGDAERLLKEAVFLNLNACIAALIGEDPYLDDNSICFHEHLGYNFVGRFCQCGYKFGRWYDMVWMEKMLGEHTVPAPAIIPFQEMKND
nr:GNAT family N-acetyltransferase [uncultured Lactobacillus sp.]